MPQKYIRFFGNESSETLLEAYWIVKREKTLAELLKPKECPSCREPNKIDAKFCSKCRMLLNYEAFDDMELSEQDKSKEAEETKAILKRFTRPSRSKESSRKNRGLYLPVSLLY